MTTNPVGVAWFDSTPGNMGKTCPDCGGDVTLSVADDPRTGTGREQYICVGCGNYHGGGKFR